MKKSFLVLGLLAFVFLGLGNVSMAQGTPVTIDGSSTYTTPSSPTTPPTTPTSNNVNINMDTSTVSPSITTPPTPSTITPCSNGKANAHVNVVGKCVCDDGYKNVGGICTSCSAEGVCCGIELNTSIPFIGKCIESQSSYKSSDETGVSGDQAFPVLMGSLTKILVTVILIVSFVLILIGGIMITTGDPSGGKKMIIKVVVGIALLGASGVILRLINPNFFG